jgi:hypothetical protein
MKTAMKVSKADLPKGVLASDTKWPKGVGVEWKRGSHGNLTFYKIRRLDGTELWVIATLLIARAGRRFSRGVSDRTYAVTLDGKVVRVGLGQHVIREVTIYIRTARLTALQQYIDLYDKGAMEANQIRDRISSRRAQGQIERAQGRSHWHWNS